MANPNTPFGFKPLDNGRPIRGTLYKADTTYNIYRFDPVQLLDTGKVTVAAVANSAPILGISLGFIDANQAGLDNNLELYPYYPASQEGPYVLVCDDPNQRYLVQSDTGGGNLSLTNIGNNVSWDWLQASSGSTTTGISKAEVDSSTAATSTNGTLKIVGFLNAADNTTGSWAKIIVKLNTPQMAAESVGTAI